MSEQENKGIEKKLHIQLSEIAGECIQTWSSSITTRPNSSCVCSTAGPQAKVRSRVQSTAGHSMKLPTASFRRNSRRDPPVH